MPLTKSKPELKSNWLNLQTDQISGSSNLTSDTQLGHFVITVSSWAIGSTNAKIIQRSNVSNVRRSDTVLKIAIQMSNR
jgi:hypothetical protein